MTEINQCAVCGGSIFTDYKVLWEELINDWELSPNEVDYINRQQGRCCSACGNNMRSLALASAIVHSFGHTGTLADFVESVAAQKIRLLEINEAGCLSPFLSKLPLHKLACYPDYDMINLSISDGAFDLVVHSDTLEHVSDPIAGLTECHRVLASSGRCIYTVPIVLGRLSKSRAGLKYSFHGQAGQYDSGYVVFTEFGSDMWRYPIEAGFTNVEVHCLEYPAALAVTATK